MRGKVVFRNLFLVVAIGWLLWCLYWPYYAVQQDKEAAIREAAETRKICLRQPTLTVAECNTDERLYQRRLLQAALPPGKTAYQSFAGETSGAALRFMSALIVIPISVSYIAAWLSFRAYHLLVRAIR